MSLASKDPQLCPEKGRCRKPCSRIPEILNILPPFLSAFGDLGPRAGTLESLDTVSISVFSLSSYSPFLEGEEKMEDILTRT